MTDSPSLDSVKKKISRLHDTFVYCLTDLGAWLAAKVSIINCLSFYSSI